MDSNNSPQDPSGNNDTSSRYQDILDQYSKQVAITPDTEAEPADQTIINPDDILKTVALQPVSTSSPPNLSPPFPTVTPELPIVPKVTETTLTSGDTQPPVVKQSKFFKIFFYFSVLVFLAVASVLALSFINGSKTASNSISPIIPTIAEPTNVPEVESFCYLNDNKYKLDETFPSSDGCNTCTCGSDGTIVCTEKTCNE